MRQKTAVGGGGSVVLYLAENEVNVRLCGKPRPLRAAPVRPAGGAAGLPPACLPLPEGRASVRARPAAAAAAVAAAARAPPMAQCQGRPTALCLPACRSLTCSRRQAVPENTRDISAERRARRQEGEKETALQVANPKIAHARACVMAAAARRRKGRNREERRGRKLGQAVVRAESPARPLPNCYLRPGCTSCCAGGIHPCRCKSSIE